MGIDRMLRRLVRVAVMVCMALGTQAARGQLSMQPSYRFMEARAGAAHRYQVTISSAGKVPQDCVVRVTNAGMSELGMPTLERVSPRGAAGWVTATPAQFTLAPGESRKVTVLVRPPTGCGGGYAAAVVCTVPPKRSSTSGAAISLSRTLASIAIITVPAARMKARVACESVGLDVNTNGRISVRARLVNSGDLHVVASGNVQVLNARGAVTMRGVFRSGLGLIFAGRSRVFETALAGRLPDGVYTVRSEFASPGGKRLAASSETYTISAGKATAGRPTPEQEAALLARVPRFSIARWRLHAELPPGGRKSDSLVVENLSGEPVRLRARLWWWGLDAKNDLAFGLRSDRTGAGMVSVPSPVVQVAPRSRVRIPFVIAVPRTARGEHYPAILLEEIGRPLPVDPKLIRQSSLVLSIAVRGTCDRGVAVQSPQFHPHPSGGGALSFWVAATGTAAVEYAGTAAITSGDGKQVGDVLKFGGAGAVLLPGARAQIKLNVPYRLDAGRHVATVVVNHLESPDLTPMRDEFAFEVAGPGKASVESPAPTRGSGRS